MRTRSAFLVGIIIASTLSVLSFWFSPSTSDFALSNYKWNGLADLRSVCTVKIISSLKKLSYSNDSSVLLVIPQKPYSQQELALIRAFVTNGGTMLITDDFGYGNTVLSYLGVSAKFSEVPLVDPLFFYRNEDFPRILSVSAEIRTQGITSLVLNYATILLQTQGMEVLASSSRASFLDINGNKEYDQSEPQGPFAVAASIPLEKGEVKLLSDSSIPINSATGLDNNLQFLEYLAFGIDPPATLIIDRSHLIQTPLDVIINWLETARTMWSQPTYLLVITGVLYIGISWSYVMKEETDEPIK